jgi:hypothetical protein
MQILVGCLFILTFPMDPTDPLTFRLIYGPPENGIRRRGSDGAVFQMLHDTSFALSMVGLFSVTGLPPQLGLDPSRLIACLRLERNGSLHLGAGVLNASTCLWGAGGFLVESTSLWQPRLPSAQGVKTMEATGSGVAFLEMFSFQRELAS